MEEVFDPTDLAFRCLVVCFSILPTTLFVAQSLLFGEPVSQAALLLVALEGLCAKCYELALAVESLSLQP